MDETSTPAALDARRRRLLFRAQHRGTRENDLLVGGFIAARIGGFTPDTLNALEDILELPDPLLADWLTGRAEIPPHPHRALLLAMRDAAGDSASAAMGS
jgi:antitoxin CptB